MKIKLNITDLSILITIASTTLYILFRPLGRELGSFAFLWAPITLLLIIIKRPSTFISGPMKILFLYGIIIVGILQYTLWKYMNNWNQTRILLEFYYLIVMTSILCYYQKKWEFIKLALICKWIFIFVIITLITTNIALFFDPYVVRQSAATGGFTVNQEQIYKLTGALNYSYAQATVCLIPILVYHIKNKKKMVFRPNVLIAILILILITQIRSQVFGNVIVATVITILSFLLSKKYTISIIIGFFISIIIVAIPNSLYSNIIYSLSLYFDPESVMHDKTLDLSKFLDNLEFDESSEVGSRAIRYPQLIQALFAKPLLGDASYESHLDIAGGAHIYWMNRLTLWGIPGFLFFIFVIYKLYKYIGSLFIKSYRFYYFLSIVAYILLGLVKSVGGREPWLMLIVIIPGIYYLPLLDKKQIKVVKPRF